MGCRLGIGRRRNLHVGKITRPVPARSMAGRHDTGYDLAWWPNAEARASYDAAPGLSGRLRWGGSQPGPLAGGSLGRRGGRAGLGLSGDLPTTAASGRYRPRAELHRYSPPQGYRLIAPVRPIEPAAPLA